MAKAQTSDVYPSLVNIITDANGDLQETVGAPPATAKLSLYNGTSGEIDLETVEASLAANDIKIEVVENNGGEDKAEYDEDTKTVSVYFRDAFTASYGGSHDTAIYNTGITLEAVALGSTGNTLQFAVIDNVQIANPISAASATGSAGGIDFEADTAGVAGNNIKISLTDGNNVADSINTTGSGTTADPYIIGVSLSGVAGTDYTTADIATLINNDASAGAIVNATAQNGTDAGATFAEIQLSGGVDAFSGNDEVKVNASDGDVTVCLVNDRTTYSNLDIYNLLTDSQYSWTSAVAAIMDVQQNANWNPSAQAINISLTLQGGVDPTGQNPVEGTAKIVTLINETPEVAAVITATGGDTSLPTAVSPTNFTGGIDLQPSDLDFNASYVCININDIHSLQQDEVGDARKILWGMLESYVQNVTGQSVENQPENFIATRGNPTLLIDQAGTRLRQTYTINAFYAVGELDLEDETEV